MAASEALRSSGGRGPVGVGVREAVAAIGALARPPAAHRSGRFAVPAAVLGTSSGAAGERVSRGDGRSGAPQPARGAAVARPVPARALLGGLLLGGLLSGAIAWAGLPDLSAAGWSLPDLASWDAASWLPLASLAGVVAAWGAAGSAPRRGGLLLGGAGYGGASTPARAERERPLQEAVVVKPTELGRPQAEFLGTVCHELRTPLTVVCGYSELLLTQGPPLEPGAARMVERIEAASGQLARLVDDLLDFSRIERGELVVNPTDFDVVPVLQEVVDGFRHLPGAARVQVELPDSLPTHGDTVRIAQSAANFLSNALKYAPQGAITLRAIVNGAATVRVEVEDSGPGIPPSEQDRVWETFYRSGDLARAGAARGSGIGLAVVKALIEAQGGVVGLCSAPGQGSRFWFDLPATAPVSA